MGYDFGNDYVDYQLTWNVAPMLYHAFSGEKGIRTIYGLTGKEAYIVVLLAIHSFQYHKEEYEKLNPENGWGSYENTLKVLLKILEECIIHPESKWEGD